MVQIIKGASKPTPVTPASKILKASAYLEQQEIDKLYADAREQHEQAMTKARQLATQAKEQAMTDGANQAFAKAAELALNIFVERSKYCEDLKNPLERLADEIAAKIFGGPLTLEKAKQDALIAEGIQKIRSRRKLKVQMTNPESLAALKNLPDFEVEAATDLPPDFLRIVTEVGSALWSEKEAIAKILGNLAVKPDDTGHPG